MRYEKGLSRVSVLIVAIIIIIIVAVAGISATILGSKTTSSTNSSTVSQTSQTSQASQTSTLPSTSTSSTAATNSNSSTTSSSSTPTTFTYETIGTYQFLDPQVSWSIFDATILQNVYDPLIWYNGTSALQTIPWLAQNYTVSADGKLVNFTLRSNIKFADGEPLNSSAVYFSFNRLLVEDGSTPTTHGSQATFFIGQLLNSSISTTLCHCSQVYDSNYVNKVLAQDFVQTTGPLTFSLHILNPTTSFPYLLSNEWGLIAAPDYVMQKDIATWTSAGYSLPYKTLSGNSDAIISQYLQDEVSTCNSGATPKGCGQTYLDNSFQGSLAGTGPYTIQNVTQSTNDLVLKLNPNYWGGPYAAKITPHFTTVNINYVPSLTTRELDLRDAASSNQALSIDLTSDHIYDVAGRAAWINNDSLVSIIPGVSVYGPYSSFTTDYVAFDMNVTNPQTGVYYSFQPFADRRIRLAFADSVNMTLINEAVNNKLGRVAINTVPPGIPPEGSYNASNTPVYSFNLTRVQDLLLSAMENPITQFHYVNGTIAKTGVFNNTFGCSVNELNSNSGRCVKPIAQSISLVYVTGDTVDQEIMSQIAAAVNNVSSTYNIGLSISLLPLPLSIYLTQTSADQAYLYAANYIDDYPYVLDFLSNIYTPGFYQAASDGWNILQMSTLYNQALSASSSGDLQGLLSVSNQMNTLANQEVMYLWTFYPLCFIISTSNVKGYYYNPSLSSARPGVGVAGPEYFAVLH